MNLLPRMEWWYWEMGVDGGLLQFQMTKPEAMAGQRLSAVMIKSFGY